MLFVRVAGQLLSFSQSIHFVFLSYALSILDLNVKSKERNCLYRQGIYRISILCQEWC